MRAVTPIWNICREGYAILREVVDGVPAACGTQASA
jgi:hypothetical protein